MGILDTLRPQPNAVENAGEPELAPAPAAPQAAPVSAPAPTTPMTAAPGGDPANIQARYYIESVGKERRYFHDLEGTRLAFKADAKAITTKAEDRATIAHMLDVAQSRGWSELHVRGSAAFKQEVWIEAQSRGLSVKGYEPTGEDRRNVEARRETRRQQAQEQTAATTATEPVNTIVNATPAPSPTQAKAEGRPLADVADKGAAHTAAVANGVAQAAQLSPAARKVLGFLEQRIKTQMAKFADDVKADLRVHAAKALAEREAEAGPVKVPTAKAARKPEQKRAKADTEQQPRMSVG